MLSEELISATAGPPTAANSAVAKDVGIYAQAVTPTYAVRTTFKRSSTPAYGLAVSESHVFAAQADKAHVHVYGRGSGKLDTLAVFPERIRCLTLVDEVLVMGTVEGRLILWEVRHTPHTSSGSYPSLHRIVC
jgi:pre-rRNA-processing protein IPI3